jgi:RNA polymerase sigma-32 factor
LTVRAGAGDADAIERLVGSHLGYVIGIARRYRGWGLPMNDLIQEGLVGLMQAVRRFDPNHDVRLSTYAVWWIRSSIQEYVLRSWSMVRVGTSNAQRLLALRLKACAHDVLAADPWSVESGSGALAKRFGTTASEVQRIARRMVGRDTSVEDTGAGSRSLLDRLVCELPTPEQVVAQISEARFVKQAMESALAQLPHREQVILRRRYFDEAKHTFAAIGRELGLSKDRVRQLESLALARMADVLRPVLAAAGVR